MPLVQDSLARGTSVRFTATGGSMRPFIRHGDTVELEAVSGTPIRVGDVVLAAAPGGLYLLHRVVARKGDSIWLAGDAQSSPQGPFARDQVLARLVGVHRRGRRVCADRSLWRALALLWIHLTPLGQVLLGLSDRARASLRNALCTS